MTARVFYVDPDTNERTELGSVLTNHGMTKEEVLEFIGAEQVNPEDEAYECCNEIPDYIINGDEYRAQDLEVVTE